MTKTTLLIAATILLGLTGFQTGCNSSSPTGTAGPAPTATPPAKIIATGPAGNSLTGTISNSEGVMKKGSQSFTLAFTDASNMPVEVGSAAINFRMAAMGSMAEMNSGATFTTTATPGVYDGKVNLDMAGDWQAMITYEGPAGKGAFLLPIVAK
jgi:hypothetical protein